MSRRLRLLIIEDREDDAVLILRDLRRGGFDVDFTLVETAAAMTRALDEQEFDLVISDFSLPEFSAPAALELLKESGLDLPFIIASGTVGEETAVTALKAGAHDFLPKQNLNRLVPAVERELRDAAVRRERRALEQQLVQAQKLEAIGRLAGGIAHDFNNILTAIQGYATLLLHELPPDTQHQQDVREILDATERASSFTRQLLSFSRNQVTQPEHLAVDEVLAEVRNLLARMIGTEYMLELELGGPPEVYVDKAQLTQVLLNLVVNARDAMPQGGRIRVCTEASVGRGRYGTPDEIPAAGEFAAIHVIDDGEGMPPDVAGRIFEPFFTTKAPGKGTGLGLSTVYGIVAQHGGSVSVDSVPGRGTRLSVYLPPAPAHAPRRLPVPTTPARAETGDPATRVVLVAEDDATVSAVVNRILASAGYTVLMAGDGDEALSTAGQVRTIDLLITDVLLPDMSGLDLVAALQRVRPGTATLVLSGYASGDLVLPLGVEFVPKPFTPEVLLEHVAKALRPG